MFEPNTSASSPLAVELSPITVERTPLDTDASPITTLWLAATVLLPMAMLLKQSDAALAPMAIVLMPVERCTRPNRRVKVPWDRAPVAEGDRVGVVARNPTPTAIELIPLPKRRWFLLGPVAADRDRPGPRRADVVADRDGLGGNCIGIMAERSRPERGSVRIIPIEVDRRRLPWRMSRPRWSDSGWLLPTCRWPCSTRRWRPRRCRTQRHCFGWRCSSRQPQSPPFRWPGRLRRPRPCRLLATASLPTAVEREPVACAPIVSTSSLSAPIAIDPAVVASLSVPTAIEPIPMALALAPIAVEFETVAAELTPRAVELSPLAVAPLPSAVELPPLAFVPLPTAVLNDPVAAAPTPQATRSSTPAEFAPPSVSVVASASPSLLLSSRQSSASAGWLPMVEVSANMANVAALASRPDSNSWIWTCYPPWH